MILATDGDAVEDLTRPASSRHVELVATDEGDRMTEAVPATDFFGATPMGSQAPQTCLPLTAAPRRDSPLF